MHLRSTEDNYGNKSGKQIHIQLCLLRIQFLKILSFVSTVFGTTTRLFFLLFIFYLQISVYLSD